MEAKEYQIKIDMQQFMEMSEEELLNCCSSIGKIIFIAVKRCKSYDGKLVDSIVYKNDGKEKLVLKIKEKEK